MADDIFGCQHPPGQVGRIDESRQQLLPEERDLAELLAAEGHDVTAVRRDNKRGAGNRTPDVDVCGHPTEFKVLESQGSAVPASRIRNSLGRAQAQGTHVIVDARTEFRAVPEDAEVGVRKFLSGEAQRKSEGTLKGEEKAAIRVIAQDFDVSYDRARVQQLRQEQIEQHERENLTPPDPAEEPPRNRFSINRPDREAEPGQEPRRRFELSRSSDDAKRYQGPSK